jgi:hypothetical protein
MTIENKSYLGDSVYAGFENGMMVLFTDNGMGPTNILYFEDKVVEALLRKIAENYDIDRCCRIMQAMKHTQSEATPEFPK